jgi:hypothetical protein
MPKLNLAEIAVTLALVAVGVAVIFRVPFLRKVLVGS